MAETAALLFTSGYIERMPDSLLIRDALAFIFSFIHECAGGDMPAYASALVLACYALIFGHGSPMVCSAGKST